MDEYIKEISEKIEDKKEYYAEISDKIWKFAEPRFQEYKYNFQIKKEKMYTQKLEKKIKK